MEPRTRPGPGTRLNGIYEIERPLGAGGMGVVFKGRAIETGEHVAIKMMSDDMAATTTARDLFRREALALGQIHDESVVRYYAFAVDPDLGVPYLVTEFVEGPSLADLLRRGPLAPESVDLLRSRLARGLAAAHRLGVVHRDISPDNIILPGSDPSRSKIIDFGIARSESHGTTIIGSGFAGKTGYVSPEQIGLFGPVTAQSDVYSLGLVLVEALRGVPVDMAGTTVEVVEKRKRLPDLGPPTFLTPLLERMLQPDPAQRAGSMDEVAAWSRPDPTRETARQQAAPAAVAAPSPATSRSAQSGAAPRWRKPAAVAAGLAVLLAAGVVAERWVRQPAGAPGTAPITASGSAPDRDASPLLSEVAPPPPNGPGAPPPTAETSPRPVPQAPVPPGPAPQSLVPPGPVTQAPTPQGPIVATLPDPPPAVPNETRLAPVVPAPDAPVPPVVDAATPSDTADLVRAAQVELTRVGCYGGPLDGALTSATRAAFEEFARENRVTWSGDVREEAVAFLKTVTGPVCASLSPGPQTPSTRQAATPAESLSCRELVEKAQLGDLSAGEKARLRTACR